MSEHTDTVDTQQCGNDQCYQELEFGQEVCTDCEMKEMAKAKRIADRKAGVAFIRQVLGVVEDNPDMPNPFNHGMCFFWSESSLDTMHELRRAIGGKWDKQYTDSGYSSDYKLKRSVGDVSVYLSAPREVVCERVVVGTKDVVKKEYDPEQLAELEQHEVVVTEDIVEWRCPGLDGNE